MNSRIINVHPHLTHAKLRVVCRDANRTFLETVKCRTHTRSTVKGYKPTAATFAPQPPVTNFFLEAANNMENGSHWH